MHFSCKKTLSPTTNSDLALPSQPCHNPCNLPSHTSLQPHSCYAFMFCCQRLQNDMNIANSKQQNKHHLTNLAKICYNKKNTTFGQTPKTCHNNLAAVHHPVFCHETAIVPNPTLPCIPFSCHNKTNTLSPVHGSHKQKGTLQQKMI